MDNFKGGNVQYFYIKFLLGGAENPLMYTIYTVITGSMTGIGAFIIYPMAKKFGIKNLTVAGYAIALFGSVLGWMFPDQLVLALIAGFLRQVGWLPNAYIFATLMCYAFDSIEYKSHLRLEGMMGVAVITAIQWLIYAPFAGGFESGILKLGFVDAVGVAPSAEVIRFMTMSFYLFDIILAAAVVILLWRSICRKSTQSCWIEKSRRCWPGAKCGSPPMSSSGWRMRRPNESTRNTESRI